MMCEWRLISCNRCTTVMVDADNGGSYAWGMWKISVPSTPFCCDDKTALKIKSIRKICWEREWKIVLFLRLASLNSIILALNFAWKCKEFLLFSSLSSVFLYPAKRTQWALSITAWKFTEPKPLINICKYYIFHISTDNSFAKISVTTSQGSIYFPPSNNNFLPILTALTSNLSETLLDVMKGLLKFLLVLTNLLTCITIIKGAFSLYQVPSSKTSTTCSKFCNSTTPLMVLNLYFKFIIINLAA